MQLTSYITNNFKPLSPKDNIGVAIALFESFNIDFLPIVEEGILIGCLPADFNLLTEEKTLIRECLNDSELFYVNRNDNLIDALRILGINDSNTVFVINNNNQYLGYITQYDVLSSLSNTPFFNELGGVIIIKKPLKDYSISEISQIVESENGKILGILITDFIDDDVVLTVKINRMRLGTIEASLKRFGYIILDSYHENKNIDDLQNRYNYLMSYLNV